LQQATHVDLIPNTPSTASSDSDLPAADSPLRGKPAPAFTLVDLAGNKVSLSDFQGHPMVVNFWATYCEPCKFEMPWLEEFSHKYAANGVKVIGVTYDSEVGVPTISKAVHKLGVTYPIVLSTPKAEKDYLSDLPDLPVSFYLDKAGKVIDVTVGIGSKNQLESMFKETIGTDAK
jgi:cytochrome c biogenesis protein CcmG/thiol:disulfide interchange protein DsbE